MQAQEQLPDVSNHVERCLQLLESKSEAELAEFLDALHPVELAATIQCMADEHRAQLIKRIAGLDQLSGFVTYASGPLRELTLSMIDDSRLAAVIRRQEIDDAVDVLSALPRRRQVSVLRRLNAKTVKELTTLLAYDQDTAGRLMNPQFVFFDIETRVADALAQLRERLADGRIAEETDLSYVYVLDATQQLRGVLSLRELLTSSNENTLGTLMHTALVTVAPDDDQEHVAHVIRDYDFASIPVVSAEDNRMLGIITVDDVIDVIEEEHTEDILLLAGTEDQDTVGASARVAFRSRLPWLLASWIGGTGGALLLGSFSSTLEKVVALAFFMPVVFGMGGNIGSQASTITVRGIATGEFSRRQAIHRLQKEAIVGVCLGVTFGLLLSGAAFVLFHDPRLALIVGMSITVTMSCASALGSMLPLAMDYLGFDPAVASGPFVTTSTDLLSIMIYFGVANWLLL